MTTSTIFNTLIFFKYKQTTNIKIGATLFLDLPMVQNLSDGEGLNTFEIMVLNVL